MWDSQNLIDALRHPSMLEALTALLLKEKKKKMCQHKKKNHHHKPTHSSHSIAATQCKSHCSPGKAERRNRTGNPGSAQRCNDLCASVKPDMAVSHGGLWLQTYSHPVYLHIGALKSPEKNLVKIYTVAFLQMRIKWPTVRRYFSQQENQRNVH